MNLRIGFKINALILITLTLGVGGMVFLATSLFTQDFSQLLHKNALDVAAILANRMKDRVTHLSNHATTLAAVSFERFQYDEDRLRFIQENLSREPFFVGVTLYGKGPGSIAPLWRVSRRDSQGAGTLSVQDFESLDQSFPLNLAEVFRGRPQCAVARLKDGTPTVRMSFPVVKLKDGTYTHIATAELQSKVLASLLEDSTGFSAMLVDHSGNVLASSDPPHWPAGSSLSSLPIFRELAQGQGSGEQVSRDRQGHATIFAFHAVGFGELGVVTTFPLMRIELTERELYIRSVLFGGILFFIALAIALAVSQAISNPIRALSGAANQVAAGDLSVRVPVPHAKAKTKRDELSILSDSFNGMAGRIQALLVETAEKARMEKEIEAAKAIQSMFIPAQDFAHANLHLSGSLISASECCGDWWQYASFDRYLLVLIGDVTGHGVSSSLLTAVAQGVFSLFLSHLKQQARSGGLPDPAHWLSALAFELNTAILGAGKRQAMMTFAASAIDLATGQVTSISLGHPTPFVYRPTSSPASSNRVRAYLPLTQGASQALGECDDLIVAPFRFSLLPGDCLLWYTDGTLDQIALSGGRSSKLKMLKLLDRVLSESAQPDPSRVGLRLSEEILKSAPPGNVLLDDITFAIAQIPWEARFELERRDAA